MPDSADTDLSVVPPSTLLSEDEKQRLAFWNSIQPTYTASTTPNQLSPGFQRDTSGSLTTNGQAPITTLPNGIPAWEQSIAGAVKKYESAGNYNVGYGGTDLSKAVLDENGFPIWAGKEGPAGISHAAGAYQFEPDTWRKYASVLGIKDFSPASQDAVFNLAVQNEKLRPWASNNALMSAIAPAAKLQPGLMGSSTAGVPQLPDSLTKPVTASAAPPQQINVNFPSDGASQEMGMKSNPMIMLSILQKMMAGTHSFTPVDYDPWKIGQLAVPKGEAA